MVRDVEPPIMPVVYIEGGVVVGMNGACANLKMGETFPGSGSLRERLKDLGLSAETPVKQVKVAMRGDRLRIR